MVEAVWDIQYSYEKAKRNTFLKKIFLYIVFTVNTEK